MTGWGEWIEMGGGVFPIEEGMNENDAHAGALQTGRRLAGGVGRERLHGKL
jgi:hypothetical protein